MTLGPWVTFLALLAPGTEVTLIASWDGYHAPVTVSSNFEFDIIKI